MILGSVYLLLGLAIMSMCFNLMQEKIFTQVKFSKRKLSNSFQLQTITKVALALLYCCRFGSSEDYWDLSRTIVMMISEL